MDQSDVASLIVDTIRKRVRASGAITRFREPVVGYVAADDPGFLQLSELIGSVHMVPDDLLPGACSVVSFFLPFAPEIAKANARESTQVAREWAVAYVETNALIGEVTDRLIDVLHREGIQAAAEPATGNFDATILRSRWSHKSVAVLAGIGSFGLHQMVITDTGCAGRFGSLVVEATLPTERARPRQRCLYHATGACMKCVQACPVDAIDPKGAFHRRACWAQCLKNATALSDLGDEVQVCGKCAVVGPCALRSAVRARCPM